MGNLSLKLKPEEDKLIALLKKQTRQATASRALIQAAEYYTKQRPKDVETIHKAELKIMELVAELVQAKQLAANFSEAVLALADFANPPKKNASKKTSS